MSEDVTASAHGASLIGSADVGTLPWQTATDEGNEGDVIVNSDDQWIASCCTAELASRIVTSVNNHERLVATLTELVSAFNPDPAFDYYPLGIWDRAAEVLASLQREALAEVPGTEGVTPKET